MKQLAPISALAVSACLCLAAPAHAQRTEENAVAQSSDAFGKSVGSERTGLYSGEDVRGFNPIDAGNARIEGLYFDQIDRISQRVTDGTTVRVGISAQHYPFPAPTGIIDVALTKPGGKFESSLEMEYGEFGGPRWAAEAKIPLQGEQLGLVVGTGGRNIEQVEGGAGKFRNLGAVLAWRPRKGAEIIAFGGAIYERSNEARPTYFTAGAYTPPKLPRRLYLGQPWTARSSDNYQYGVVVKLPLDAFKLEFGLFRTERMVDRTFADLLTGVTQIGEVTRRTLIADGNNLDRSTSGELRLTRERTSGQLRHSFTLSVRGRAKDREFGGTQTIPILNPLSALTPDVRTPPAINLGPENKDRVRQITYGAAYGVAWAGRGALDVNIAQSRYRKSVDFADPLAPDVTTRDNPILWNVSGSLILTKRLALYAGYVKGLEEALIAPDIATNRSEAPPAIRTRQIDAGLRYAIRPDLTLVAGLFSVKKPYFNLDPASRYRQLGIIDSRGVEISLAGKLRPGLSLVAGTVLLDPKISGEAVTAGQIGSRPVGSLTRRTIANLDWRLNGGKSPFSFDMAVESVSARMARADNSFSAPPRTTLNLGARYRFKLAGAKALVRAQVINLFNQYGWNVSSSGGYTYTTSRTGALQLVLDL